jgi:histidinol dehydrogenase
VFRVGGAQAVGAMAYGTASIPRVDVICGPGNVFVTEAKRQVYGCVGIDNLAGPSEVLVVADQSANAEWVAADLLAQEEHGSGATAVLMAKSEGLCAKVQECIDRLRPLGADSRPGAAASAGASPRSAADSRLTAFYPAAGENFLDLAEVLVNTYAPEHLEIQLADSRSFLPRVRSAGAIFIGRLTPTAFGDYMAGSNHVLPTGGSARFSSPLSVDTFMRKSSYVEITEEAVPLLTPPLARVADSEGFTFHRMSAELRAAKRELPRPRSAEPPNDVAG